MCSDDRMSEGIYYWENARGFQQYDSITHSREKKGRLGVVENTISVLLEFDIESEGDQYQTS